MLFDREQLDIKPLAERVNDIDLSLIKAPDRGLAVTDKRWNTIAGRIVSAKKSGSSVILMTGGHMFRSGVQKYLIDLMERGYISCLATNGSGMIHDFEYALIGATTESVPKYIAKGQFGLWKETSKLNDIINAAYRKDPKVGMGEAVGQASNDLPHSDISLLAAGYRLNIPVTVHIGIGCDIIHEHPNCDGAATGALSYNDFLNLASAVQKLENGVVMNFGSAVMAPEVYLKALSMARNIARGHNASISKFTTVVCDLHALPDDYSREPAKDDPAYYFRPWKTMLVRTVADGGESFYIRGKHAETVPQLWAAINEAEK